MFPQFPEKVCDVGGKFQVISVKKIKKQFIDNIGSVIRNSNYENCDEIKSWIGQLLKLAVLLNLINEFIIEIDTYAVE